ncbi:T9SS type A sorting domain-containing protein [bacterium]|nr:T9SS type A sorting domain-containing protein [bacterium]
MKKVVIVLMCMVLGTGWIMAQDTLSVGQLDPSQGEFLNEVIANDNGAHAVYKLTRGETYFLNGPILTTESALNLIGEAGPVETAPAVIRPALLPDGTIPQANFDVSGDFILKNVYVVSVGPLGQLQQQYSAQIKTDSVYVLIDNVVWEGNNEFGVRIYGAHPTIRVLNSKWRNNINVGSYYNGRMLWTDQPSESIQLINNTMMNCVAYFLVDRGSKNVKIDHNTLVNILYTPFFMHQMYNAEFTNNILYNCHFMGQSDLEYNGGWDDSDNEHAAIFSVDTLSATTLENWQVDNPSATEADRNLVVKNNAYFWAPEFETFWSSADSLHGGYFMNDRTIAMFADDANYPGLVEEGNVNVMPNFVNKPDTEDEQLIQCNAFRQPGGPVNVYWGFGDMGTITWPLPEDLSYDNADLMVASTSGGPIGDLNWFDLATAVEDKASALPRGFSLEQNYPNPFNPTTRLKYSVKEAGEISLLVYDVLGRQVKALFDEELRGAGSYELDLDMSDMPSGVYYAVLKKGGARVVQKMVLMK